jgi:hypothetical protein
MPVEIALTNVDIEAGKVGESNTWLMGFRDARSSLVVSVAFEERKLRETCEQILRALDGGDPARKVDLVVAKSIPA